MGEVDAVLASVSDMLYSWGLMWLLIGAGVFFTVRTRGVQVRHTDAIAASVIGSRDGSHGGITSFQAFAISLAVRVGVGNVFGELRYFFDLAHGVWAGGGWECAFLPEEALEERRTHECPVLNDGSSAL